MTLTEDKLAVEYIGILIILLTAKMLVPFQFLQKILQFFFIIGIYLLIATILMVLLFLSYRKHINSNDGFAE